MDDRYRGLGNEPTAQDPAYRRSIPLIVSTGGHLPVNISHIVRVLKEDAAVQAPYPRRGKSRSRLGSRSHHHRGHRRSPGIGRSASRRRKSSRRTTGTVVVAALALMGLLVVFGLFPDQSTLTEVDAQDRTAEELLDHLQTGERDFSAEYQREYFGDGWLDLDGDGCSTRNEILARDLHNVTYRSGTDDCVVDSGVLEDLYTGQTLTFQRGEDTSSEVQIDHVVALSDAWQKGAQELSEDQRHRFANDPLNLEAVSGPVNTAKSNSDASEWLPPDPESHCEYAGRQISVKAKYELWVTAEERQALENILQTCPDQPGYESAV